MAKLTKEKGLIIGGAIVGLLMGGTAMGAPQSTSDQGNAFFKFSEVQSVNPLAAAGEEGDKDGKGDKACGEGSCG